MLGSSSVVAQLAASQEELCSMKFVSWECDMGIRHERIYNLNAKHCLYTTAYKHEISKLEFVNG
jgi:hypothetical protein